MELKVKETIENILEIKEKHKYYREEQKFNSYTDIKFTYHLRMKYQRKYSNYLMMMLKKLKDIVFENGYFEKITTLSSTKFYYFSIVLDPCSLDKNIYLFSKIKEFVEFSQDYFSFLEFDTYKESGIEISFLKDKSWNKNKVHKRIISFLIDQNQCFLISREQKIPCFFEYRDYINHQLIEGSNFCLLNYLKRSEIEFRYIKPSNTKEELKNFLKGLLYELYYENFSFKMRMELKYPYKRKRIYHCFRYLEQKLIKEDKNKNILVYTLDRRTPVLLNITEEMEQEIKRKLTIDAV